MGIGPPFLFLFYLSEVWGVERHWVFKWKKPAFEAGFFLHPLVLWQYYLVTTEALRTCWMYVMICPSAAARTSACFLAFAI